MKKMSRDMKTVVIMIAVFAVIVLAYIVQDLYFSSSGKLETEYISLTSEKEVVSVNGFVVRDENRTDDAGSSTSVLYMQNQRTYIPTVTDSTSVAFGDTIAVSFASETQAQTYQKSLELQSKISYLQSIQDQESLSYVNVVALNSEIATAIHDYLELIDSNKLSSLEDAVRKVNYKITTKQIATGTQMNFSKLLRRYEKQLAALDIGSMKAIPVRSPYAGYFVSHVDGFESAFDFSALSSDAVTTQQVDDLLAGKAENTDGAYGKIIGQHTWYLLCKMPQNRASVVKKGYYVTVSFPEKGLYDLPMRVQSVSNRADGDVAVVFKCTLMNEALSVLRKEKAEITVKTYDGFRISNDALVENDEGLTGVYVLSGKRVVFKPIKILYHADNHVMAAAAVYYKSNGEIDTEKTPDLPQLEAYDRVIVKGKNLYDGKVINNIS